MLVLCGMESPSNYPVLLYERSWHEMLFVCVSHFTVLRQEARNVQINFSAAFLILFKLWSVGVGDSLLSVLSQFLFNQPEYVVAYGSRSNWLTWFEECLRKCVDPVVLSVHRRAFNHAEEQALRLC